MAKTTVNNNLNAGNGAVSIKRVDGKDVSSGTSTSAYKNAPGPRDATGTKGS